MLWADNNRLFCDNTERLVCMVNDIIEELLVLDMEPKLESLSWACTYEREDTTTLKVGSRGNTWDLPFREVFEILGYRYHRDGKGIPRRRTNCVQGHGEMVAGQVRIPCEDGAHVD